MGEELWLALERLVQATEMATAAATTETRVLSKASGTLLNTGKNASKVVGKGVRNPKVKNALDRGLEAHNKLKARVETKNWLSSPRIEGLNGKYYRPDVVTKNNRFMELKPNTLSGRAAGKRQSKIYQEQLKMKGRVIYYDP
jgi:hypothetical protein